MRIMVIDCETGGFDSRRDALLTLALVPVVAGRVERGVEFKINGSGNVSAEALERNHIDLEKHRAIARTPVETCNDMQALFARYYKPTEWVELAGHHQGFDVHFLRELWRDGATVPFTRRFSSRQRCTMTLAQHLRDSGAVPFRDCKLETVCEYYGVVNAAPHTALGDATSTAHVYVRMLGDLQRAFASRPTLVHRGPPAETVTLPHDGTPAGDADLVSP